MCIEILEFKIVHCFSWKNIYSCSGAMCYARKIWWFITDREKASMIESPYSRVGLIVGEEHV